MTVMPLSSRNFASAKYPGPRALESAQSTAPGSRLSAQLAPAPEPGRSGRDDTMTAFAELVAATNFSFLRGASHAHEMVGQAAELGLAAIGIADRNTLAGVVRAHQAAKEHKIRLAVGARLLTTEGFETVCYPTDRAAYGRLCRLLTRATAAPSRANAISPSTS